MKRLMLMLTLIGFGYLCFANYRSFDACFGILENLTDTFFVRQEIKRVASAVEQEYITSQSYPSPRHFDDFIRGSLKTNVNSKRDPANDWWGTPYQFSVYDTGFGVGCAGPDKKWKTRDDIWIHRQQGKIPGVGR